MKLDIGCGSYCRGDVGIDINFSWYNPKHRPEFFDKIGGKKRENADLVMADANYPLPFRDRAFNEVTMIHVIEHLYRPLDCLKEIHRVLKTQGKLILVTPNAKKSQADWLDDGHILSFTEPTITRLVSLAFNKVKCIILKENPFFEQDLLVIAIKEK